ncbi:helix-hairpin-helix domain-containing protein [Aurantiacibacter rhizosphaerae]|uniref:Uncharacterized protein n=1 Tax=Aurantiacibacter rhizosphaerae TaxID=2691582 RepID=A0A844XGD3_9SPHN|nr:helix-hairpin-helix domain-containing protein [Aurantiacibacter rhizosphaerae]MWV28585.1 hypothetical protein [Aurantiacibacter rhizosphaerae]
MVELLQANWILVVLALVIGLLVAWWIFVASRRTKVQVEERDDTAPTTAKRNQALIDSPPAATTGDGIAPPDYADAQDAEAARTAASPGPTSAAANADNTAAAALGTDAEAGDGVPARAAIKDTPPPPPAKDEAQPEATPAATSSQPASTSDADDLRRIKGVGPKLVTILHEHGVTSFAQIAAWTEQDIDSIDAQLGRFQGRIRRDNWVEQAALLKDGDTAAYEARFGRIA